MVRVFEASLARLGGPGERTLFVAEKLRRQQTLRKGGAVERNETFRPAPAVVVDGAGDQLLTGAAPAGDEDGGVGGRDLLEHVEDLLHLLRGADDALKAVALVNLKIELDVVADEGLLLRGLLELGAEDVEIDRLVEIVVRALVECLEGGLVRRIAGHHDDLGVRIPAPGMADDVDAAEVAHDEVGDDHVVVVFVDGFRALLPAEGERAPVAGALQRFARGFGVRTIVVDDQDAGFIGHGGARW